jgi:hypothetical protein
MNKQIGSALSRRDSAICNMAPQCHGVVAMLSEILVGGQLIGLVMMPGNRSTDKNPTAARMLPANWIRTFPSTMAPVLRWQRDLRRQTDKLRCCTSGVACAAGALSRPFSCGRSQLDNDLAGRPVLYCPVGFGGLVEPVPDDR